MWKENWFWEKVGEWEEVKSAKTPLDDLEIYEKIVCKFDGAKASDKESILGGKIEFVGNEKGWTAYYGLRKNGVNKLAIEEISDYFEIEKDKDGYVVKMLSDETEKVIKDGKEIYKRKVGERVLRLKEADPDKITKEILSTKSYYRETAPILIGVLVGELIKRLEKK